MDAGAFAVIPHWVPLGAYASKDAAHYLFLTSAGAIEMTHRFEGDRTLASVSANLPVFSWDEREMAQECDVAFTRLPDARPLRMRDGTMPEAVLANGAGLVHFVVGPVHAGIIEPGRFTFSSGGETVVHLDAQLGYSHRGIERRLEGVDALEAAALVARVCGGCSASRSFAYARALEMPAGARIEPEVDLARLVIAELERVYNHLGDLAACAAGAGYGPGFTTGMALKERLQRLNAFATGHRLLFDAIVPGGVAPGVLSNREGVRNYVASVSPPIERYLAELFGNASVVSRWHRAGLVRRETAVAFGAVGPAHRASHGEVDVRVFAPYGAYRAIPALVAHATTGDAEARCRVKADEIRESLRLISEALSALGEAPLPAPATLRVPEGGATAVVEGPRGAETVSVHVDDEARIERLHVISASYRNWPIVALAMDANIVPDFPLVNKSFNLCYACADR